MAELRPPAELVIDSSLATNWKRFKESFKIYSLAKELSGKDKSVQAVILLNFIGPDAYDLLKSLSDKEDDFKDPAKVISLLDNISNSACRTPLRVYLDDWSLFNERTPNHFNMTPARLSRCLIKDLLFVPDLCSLGFRQRTGIVYYSAIFWYRSKFVCLLELFY